MRTRWLTLLLLVPLGLILAGCDDAAFNSIDPNVSGVQARATLEYIQAVQTSTAQSLYVAERQATIQAAETRDAQQATYSAAQATEDNLRTVAAATQTQQVWNATGTAAASQATMTAAAIGTQSSWAGTATQSAWNVQATAEAAGLQALQTAQAAQAEMARLAAERQRTINTVQATAPWVILTILVPLAAYLAWMWGNAEALRRRAIPRDPRGDAPILILDGHGHRNVIDPDLFFGSALSIGRNGRLEGPALAGLDYQSQVKARDQAVDLVSRGLPGQPAQHRRPAGLLPAQPRSPLAKVRMVDSEEVKEWLPDVLAPIHRQALEEGENRDE